MDLTKVSKALQNEIRQQIVQNMSDKGVTSALVSKRYGITKPIALRHLESLENAGFLVSKRDRPSKGKPPMRFYLKPNIKKKFSLGNIKINLVISQNGKGKK